MKKNVKFLLTFPLSVCFVFVCSNCSLSKEKDKPPCQVISCFEISFLESYLRYFDSDNIFFIKGEVQEKIDYGCKIKLIEDFKGNFPKNIDTFTAWGDGKAYIELNRVDDFSLYKDKDILLMLLTPKGPIVDCIPEKKNPEKKGDFSTITCAFSVLRLSDDVYVTGRIGPFVEDPSSWEEKTMLWEELSMTLLKYLKIFKQGT